MQFKQKSVKAQIADQVQEHDETWDAVNRWAQGQYTDQEFLNCLRSIQESVIVGFYQQNRMDEEECDRLCAMEKEGA